MRLLAALWSTLFGRSPPDAAPVADAEARPGFVAGAFLDRPALACRFAIRRAVIGYVDADGVPSFRTVSFDEAYRQNGQLYLGGYCHERFDRRHFRLDQIAFLHRFNTGEHVDPAAEVARWVGEPV